MRVALALVHLLVVWGGFGFVLWSGGSQVWTGAWDLSPSSAELWSTRAVLLIAGVMYLLAIRILSVPFDVFLAGMDALRTTANAERTPAESSQVFGEASVQPAVGRNGEGAVMTRNGRRASASSEGVV